MAFPIIIPAQETNLNPASVQKAFQALPQGYGSIRLGMGFEEATEILRRSSSFTWRGQPEVSLSPDGLDKIVESTGARYLNKGIFQFEKEKLFAIILDFNPEQIDFFMVLSNLTERYGEPVSLDNKRVIWENQNIRLSLEKPLTLKYLDRGVIDRRSKAAGVDKAIQEESREMFLDSL
jgi:hypothetical protein